MTTYPYATRVTSDSTAVIVAQSVAGEVAVEFLVRNTHATLSIFVGAANVLTSTGYEIRAGEALSLTLGYGHNSGVASQVLYTISASAVTVDVIARLAQ